MWWTTRPSGTAAFIDHCPDRESTYDATTALYRNSSWYADPARVAKAKLEPLAAGLLPRVGREKEASSSLLRKHLRRDFFLRWRRDSAPHCPVAQGRGRLDRFGKEDFDKYWAEYVEHLYTHHFDPSQLWLMLTQSGVLLKHTSAWSYFEEVLFGVTPGGESRVWLCHDDFSRLLS